MTTTSSPTIAFVGDLTIDTYPKQNKIILGGCSMNGAMWAKRLGARPAIVAAVGNDAAGKKYLSMLEKQHINGDFVSVVDHTQTSYINIHIDAQGERKFQEWHPGALAKFHLDENSYNFLSQQDALLMTIYKPTEHILNEFITLHAKNRPDKPLLAIDLADLSTFEKNIDIVKMALTMFDFIFLGLSAKEKKFLHTLQGLAFKGGTCIIVTLGADGVIAFHKDNTYSEQATHTPVVDTTGAGDAFIAGFLTTFLKTHDIQKSLKKGTLTASRAIQKIGAY